MNEDKQARWKGAGMGEFDGYIIGNIHDKAKGEGE